MRGLLPVSHELTAIGDDRRTASKDQFDLVIEAGRTEGQYWRDVWRYRELLFFLAWRDVLVRYKQTFIGVTWTLIRPLLVLIVFTIVFGKLAGLPSPGGAPYPILVFAAMLPWQFFSNALSASGESIVANASLISKVYFPRMIVPVSSVAASFVDFLISGAILIGLMTWYSYWPTWRMAALPALTVVAIMAALGVGFWLSALTVKYRDFRYATPFIVQFGLYISPVGFSSDIVPEQWRLLFSVNPMVSVIDGFRWAILGNDAGIYWPGMTLSLFLVALTFVSGLRYFRKTEQTFADVI